MNDAFLAKEKKGELEKREPSEMRKETSHSILF